MSLISQRVDNLLGGVSQHPEQLRAPSQATEQINCLSSPAVGLAKRPPTEHVARLIEDPTGYDGAFIHDIQRDDDSRYRVILTEGAVKVFDSDTGEEKPVSLVSGAADYLTADGDYRAVSIGDTTLVTNRSKVVSFRRDRKSAIPAPEALVFVRQADFSTAYSITVDGKTAQFVTVDGSRPETRQQINTDFIAFKLYERLYKEIHSDFSISQHGSTLSIRKWDGSDFTISTADGLGDAGLRVIKGSIQTREELPLTARDGFVIEVVGEGSTAKDNYYLVYDTKGTAGDSGVWRETVRPDTLTDLEPSSLPHVLVNGGEFLPEHPCSPLPPIPEVTDGAVEIKHAGWTEDASGNSVPEAQDDHLATHLEKRQRTLAGFSVEESPMVRANFSVDTSTMETGSAVDVVLTRTRGGVPSEVSRRTYLAGQTLEGEYVEGRVGVVNGDKLALSLEYAEGAAPPASRRALLVAPRMFTGETGFAVTRAYDSAPPSGGTRRPPDEEDPADNGAGGNGSGGSGGDTRGPGGGNRGEETRELFMEILPFTLNNSTGQAEIRARVKAAAGLTVTSVNFDFGDSTPLTPVADSGGGNYIVTHTWAIGAYNLRVIATDSAGTTEERSATVLRKASGTSGGGNPPGGGSRGDTLFSRFIWTHGRDQTISFDASASRSVAGEVVSFVWDFGDGQAGSGKTTSHRYTAVGAYTARLTITDEDGNTDTESSRVYVSRDVTAEPPRPPAVQTRKVLSRFISFGAAQLFPAGYEVRVDVGSDPFYLAAPNRDVVGGELAEYLRTVIDSHASYVASMVAPGVVEVKMAAAGAEAPAVTVRPLTIQANTAWLPTAAMSDNALIGKIAVNVTDGSTGTILSNTRTTVVVSKLEDGGFNRFHAGDRVRAVGPEGTFTFGPAAWTPRTVGDPDTNPWPGVVGKRVVDLFYHKGRLGLLTGEGYVLSAAGEMYRLFRSTVTNLLPTDPISLDTAHPDAANFHAALAWNGGIYLFTGNHEYQLTGEPLAPTTAGLLLVSSYGSSPDLRPFPAGGRLFLGKTRTGLTQVVEYQHRKDYPPAADDVTAHAPSYLRGEPWAFAGDGSLGFLTVLTEAKRDSLYVYFYTHREDGVRMQAAWSRWDFSPGSTILHTSMLAGKLALIVKRRDGIFYETLDLADALQWDG